jgi:uncharacterized protein YfiM (DUF2279 family)
MLAIPHDKALHFMYGTTSSFTGACVGLLAEAHPAIAAVAATLMMGACKEAWDEVSDGSVSVRDFLATLAGGIPVILLTWWMA